jgi:hypothetical protein
VGLDDGDLAGRDQGVGDQRSFVDDRELRLGFDDGLPRRGFDDEVDLHGLTGAVADRVGEHSGITAADAFGREGTRHAEHQRAVPM